ncbi:acetaldehyde dehydrogenase (acetylating) [Propioniciclava coleopterorum]|uniref:Acetaldehyde dehydrogenase n=1 Tax=Propioniciclava coleopterorum TaxID=2714937 RepID=A0A6G7Y344_9ACTN|nr:acetaldehyde dehydrogenase (acetylating) [Propioniciclava coleopterorum]QIK71304.1 acetaldehyde dehydrogenase (acetylating) [Propioniciclava coleopterorum]
MSVKAAIIGSGNIGTDLMIKILRGGGDLEVAALVGIDPDSDGLARAARLGVAAIDTGVDGLIASPVFDDVEIVFDATSAKAHVYDDAALRAAKPGIRVVDLTPAAIGPFCVPVANLVEVIDAPNVNMVTCGGQATVPIVHAISSVAPVEYAEIVASISSRSAGPGTRANIDEFTETTAHALEQVGGAARGKAIIILNPAEPPVLMRDTVFCLTRSGEPDAIRAAVEARVAEVAAYVPGYRLKQDVQFDAIAEPITLPDGATFTGLKVSVFLEVEGAAHYLPAYAGNLDIMTSAALRTGQAIAATLHDTQEATA